MIFYHIIIFYFSCSLVSCSFYWGLRARSRCWPAQPRTEQCSAWTCGRPSAGWCCSLSSWSARSCQPCRRLFISVLSGPPSERSAVLQKIIRLAWMSMFILLCLSATHSLLAATFAISQTAVFYGFYSIRCIVSLAPWPDSFIFTFLGSAIIPIFSSLFSIPPLFASSTLYHALLLLSYSTNPGKASLLHLVFAIIAFAFLLPRELSSISMLSFVSIEHEVLTITSTVLFSLLFFVVFRLLSALFLFLFQSDHLLISPPSAKAPVFRARNFFCWRLISYFCKF